MTAAVAAPAPAKPARTRKAVTTDGKPQKAPAKASARKTAPKAAAAPLTAPLAAGEVKLFKIRKSGTRRSIPYLAPGSPARAQAEKVAAMRDGGKTIPAICEELHESTSTVRRAISNLALAQALEGGATEADITARGLLVERKPA